MPELDEDIDADELMTAVELAEPSSASPLVVDATEDPTASCTLEARPAAVVGVFTELGTNVPQLADDAGVLYRRYIRGQGWGEVREAHCINPTCSVASFGYGQPGRYLVGALGCDDYAMTIIDVDETRDGCHVDTQYVALVLDEAGPACFDQAEFASTNLADTSSWTREGSSTPAASTDSLLAHGDCPVEFDRPSLVVTPGVRQEDIFWPESPDWIVSRHQTEDSFTRMDCLSRECTSYLDGWGLTGSFEVEAEICGQHVEQTFEVLPSADGCNVDTRWAYLSVDAEDCIDDLVQ